MANRCNAINALFGSFLAGIDKYQYNQTPIRLILDYKGLESAFPLEKSRITISNQELENYKQETWSQPLFTKPAAGEIHKVREANHPEFMKKPPELYTWLVEVKFKNYEEANYKDGKKQFDDLKEQMDAEEAKNDKEVEDYAKRNSTEEIKGKQDLPSKGTASSSKTGTAKGKDSGEKLNNASKDTQDIIGGVEFDLMKEFTEVRDNLYFADYIMSMLSYDTYELEGKYSLLRKGYEKEDIYTVDGGEITPQKAPSMYATQETNWKNDQTTFTHNKTLTNQMITIENNFSYGNETEYILYGNKIAENKLASYATIYSLRYAVNIAPVFGEYWSKQIVESIAQAIWGATSGVIPIPLVKLIICLGITAAETAVDITYIKAGLPVIFIKTNNNLFLILSGSGGKISGFENNSKRELSGNKPCFSYSDYLYLFLLIGIATNPDSIYLRTADVIQCNMQKLPDNIDFKMSKSIVYFQLDADVKVSPLMLGIPFSRQEGADILDTSSWNSFSYHGVRGY